MFRVYILERLQNFLQRESSLLLTVFAINSPPNSSSNPQITQINTAHFTWDYGIDCVPITSSDRYQKINTQMAKGLHQPDLAARCVANHKSCGSSRENICAYARVCFV